MKNVSLSIKTLFLQLAYPEHLIHSMISNFITFKQTPAPPRESTFDLQSVRIVLPFKEQKSPDSVRKQLKDLGKLLNIDLHPVFISRKVFSFFQILSFFLKDYGGKFLLHCNFSGTDLPSCLPNFYSECFEVWDNPCVKPILSREQALNQLLWNNQFLRIGGKPIFKKTLFSKRLVSLADILTNTGSLKPWTFFKAEGLNINDYLLLFGLFNSLPPTWKKLINSEDDTSADILADSRNTMLTYTLYLKDSTLPLVSINSNS